MKQFQDPNLREAIYGIYAATFNATKLSPHFHNGKVTTIMTDVMGIEDVGWRVVGVTPEALALMQQNLFKKVPKTMCRGHINDRSATVRQLFDGEKPAPISEFFDLYLHNDRTVLMLNSQNTHGKVFPDYIPIDNPDAELFPNGSLMGWKHRKKEREFLKQLWEMYQRAQGKPAINPVTNS